jgi:hypothetical protein
MTIPPLVAVALLLAQNADPRVFIQPALVVTVQPAATADHRIAPPLGGHAVGLSLGAGGFVTPTIGVEGEFLFSGSVTTQQRFTYFWYEDFTGDTRDVAMNALLRVRPSRARWFEIVGGGGLDIVRSGRRHIVRTDTYPTPPHTTPQPDHFTTYHRLNFTVGAELALPGGRRTAIVPSFRARWRDRVSTDEMYYGIGAFAMEFGVGIRGLF